MNFKSYTIIILKNDTINYFCSSDNDNGFFFFCYNLNNVIQILHTFFTIIIKLITSKLLFPITFVIPYPKSRKKTLIF